MIFELKKYIYDKSSIYKLKKLTEKKIDIFTILKFI